MAQSELTSFLKLKDLSVSQESFELLYDEETELVCTFPQPKAEHLAGYYESENYISHTDSKRNIFEKLYHAVKKIAIKSKLRLVDKAVPQGGTLLDIGAGTGDFLCEAQAQGWTTIGYEPSSIARQSAAGKSINWIDTLSQVPDHSVHAITLWHVLEHIPELDTQLNELKRMLHPQGVLIVAVPNYKSFDAQYYNQFWAAYDVPRHLWHFSQSAMAKLMLRFGFTIEQKHPMYFDSFYVSLLSEKYKTGKMNFFKAFFIGLKSNLKAVNSSEYSSIIYQIRSETLK